MKLIGLVGGISWYSTIEYYRHLNTEVNKRQGGHEAARVLINSVNYGDIVRFTKADEWDRIAQLVTEAAKKLEAAGADCLMLGANTMHRIADMVMATIHIPLIHIAEATALEVAKAGANRVALLGTQYTMKLPFYKEKLKARQIDVVVPDEEEIAFINTTIYEEMGKGIFLQETRSRYLDIINRLAQSGAQGIIMGCTEIPLLINQKDVTLPLFDTTLIHARAAVDFALS